MGIIRTLIIVIGMTSLIGLTSCSSIRKHRVFYPCAEEICPKCNGEKSYVCPRCNGRRWLPPSFSMGFGTSFYHGRHHHHPFCYSSFGFYFEECPRCDGRGLIQCGTTTYFWKCRKCNTRYDYSVKPCPECGSR